MAYLKWVYGIFNLLFLYLNQITNKISEDLIKISEDLINYLPEYPWYEYTYNSNDQFDENLPKLINAGNHFISLYINTDDCQSNFLPSNQILQITFTIPLPTAGIYFTVYFD